MKHTNRLLILLLALLLAVAALPQTAYAEDRCPNSQTGKHIWSAWKIKTEPTCTTDGVKTRMCAACKKNERRTVPALGHTWDEGAVTLEPHGFTPGERTFTCTACKEMRREKLDPTEALFDQIRHKPIQKPFTPISPLVITEQPASGWVPYWHRDYWETGHHMLHVAAEGGVEPYTYQWYYAPIPPKALPASEFKRGVLQQAENVSGIVHQVEGRIKPVLAGWKDGWLADAGIALQPAAEPGLFRFYPDTKTVPKGTEPDYKVDRGGYVFWCVVTDAIHQTAVSNVAEVRLGVYFIEQPEDAVLEGGSATLHTRVGGGYGPYQYELVRLDPEADYYEDNAVIITTYVGDTTADLPAAEPGEYTFYVTDLTTGEWGHSDFVWVRDPGEGPQDGSEPEGAPAEAPAPEAPAEAPEGEKDGAQPEDLGRSLTGDWFADVRGRLVRLTLSEDGAYTVAFLSGPEAEQKGVWAVRDGEIFLDGNGEVGLWVREDGLLLTEANVLLRREAPEPYAPAELAADATPQERFGGYWKARYVGVDGAVLDAEVLPADVFIEGTNAALGGDFFGDILVALTYADGTMTLSGEGGSLLLQLQQDGLLRLTVTAEGEEVVFYLAPAGE